jgi:hypothetical protein
MQDERLNFDPVSGNSQSPDLKNLLQDVLKQWMCRLAVFNWAYRNGYDDTRCVFWPASGTCHRELYGFFSARAALYLSQYEEALQELENTLPFERFLQEYIRPPLLSEPMIGSRLRFVVRP